MARASTPRRLARRPPPAAGERQPHQAGQHEVEGDLGRQAPHLCQSVGQLVVDVDVAHQQGRRPTRRHSPRGCPAAGSAPRRRSARRRGRCRRRASTGSAPVDGGGSPARCRVEPGPRQQEARQHEEDRHADVEPRERGAPDRVGVAPRPEGRVRGEDRHSRHGAQGVERWEADLRVPAAGSAWLRLSHGSGTGAQYCARHVGQRRAVAHVLVRRGGHAQGAGALVAARDCVASVGWQWLRGRPRRAREPRVLRLGRAPPVPTSRTVPLHVAQRAGRRGRARPTTSWSDHPGARVLEIGNVLGHYLPSRHTVVDKYEQARASSTSTSPTSTSGRSSTWCIAISTLEHVGLDEDVADPRSPVAPSSDCARTSRRAAALGDPPGRLQPGPRRADPRRRARLHRTCGRCAANATRNEWREVPLARSGRPRTTACSTPPTASWWPRSDAPESTVLRVGADDVTGW